MLPVYRGVVHPWLCDAMGHLTTRHYLAMFDDAIYHLYQQVFGYAGPFGAFAETDLYRSCASSAEH